MNIRFYNARVLIPDPTGEKGQMTVLEQANLWVQDAKILYVGKEDSPAELYAQNAMFTIHWDEEIDCEGNLLIPGFIDAHTHSPMTCFRSLADDLPLEEWLTKQIFPKEALLCEEDMYWFTKLAILEYLTSGITSIFDMYFAVDAVARACREYGYRLTMCGAVNDNCQSVCIMEELYDRYNKPGDEMVRYRLGFHAQYTTSDQMIRQIASLSQKKAAPVYMHLSETEEEVRQCRKKWHMSPVQYLDSCGIFEYGGAGFHCVTVDEQDIDIMKRKKVGVITCPASNLKLASGIAPIARLQKEKINIAIGTDGPASNNALDMFREMYLTSALSKVKTGNAAETKAAEVFRMATVNAARMLELGDLGELRAGANADVVMIDLNQPNMQPVNHMVDNLVYSGNKQNVKLTMVNGKILYYDQKFFLPEDPAEVYQKCQNIIKNRFHS